jgi:hypothetical protein
VTREAAGGPGQAESGQRKGPAAAAATRSSRRLGESEYDSDKKNLKARESLDAQETTLAQEFIERVKCHGYLGHQPDCEALPCVTLAPVRNVVAGKSTHWHGSSAAAILPEKAEGVLNVLEFFIQPTDGKFGI